MGSGVNIADQSDPRHGWQLADEKNDLTRVDHRRLVDRDGRGGRYLVRVHYCGRDGLNPIFRTGFPSLNQSLHNVVTAS